MNRILTAKDLGWVHSLIMGVCDPELEDCPQLTPSQIASEICLFIRSGDILATTNNGSNVGLVVLEDDTTAAVHFYSKGSSTKELVDLIDYTSNCAFSWSENIQTILSETLYKGFVRMGQKAKFDWIDTEERPWGSTSRTVYLLKRRRL